jgi:hypothetical protein
MRYVPLISGSTGSFTLFLISPNGTLTNPGQANPGQTKISVVNPDPQGSETFAGSRSVTRGYGSGFGSETGLESY